MADDDDRTTTSTKARWEQTGTLTALLLVGTTCASVGLLLFRGQTVPLWLATTFVLSVLAAAAWTFGESALKAASEARSGGQQ